MKTISHITKGIKNIYSVISYKRINILPKLLGNYFFAFFRIIKNVPAPLELQIEVSSLCNLRCEMCHITSRAPSIQAKQITRDQFGSMIGNSLPLMKVAFIGLGEVFTNKELFQLITHVTRQNISLFFYTNGMLLVDKNIDALISNDVKEFGISFESGIPENFEKIRKGAKFSTIVDNIESVRKRYKEANKQIDISFGSVLLEKNIQEPENLLSIIDLANDLSISLVNFANIANIKESGLYKYYSDATENAKLVKLFARLQEHADFKNVRIRLPKTSLSKRECRLPWVAGFVSVEGEVLPCCALMELGDHDEMVSLYSLGNLIHQPLSEIWNSIKAIDFRRRLSSSETYECCTKCSYYSGVL